jgi:hypothetical protein
MKLALSAKVTIDPRRLQKSRWVHDTAHLLVDAVRRARTAEGRPNDRSRKH